MIDAILDAVAANVEQLRSTERVVDLLWWEEQRDWLRSHRDDLAALLGP